ncbi:MAG: ThuA domain-containing protein [Chitinophagaceae bacterium]|nr:ThuA domain-containing protein [Chitinophagaceae bacterium]
MLKYISFLLFLMFSFSYSFAQKGQLKNANVLIYTKNGKGYIHDNIPAAVKAIQSIAKNEKFNVVVSDDASIFTQEKLKNFSILIFPSTNNDVFDNNEQRLAFRRYMEAGGGFVGIHSVTGTERNWTWFKMMLGCTFSWHAKYQKFTVRKLDAAHPSMKNVPLVWEREDECYFGKELYPVTHVLMGHQISSLIQNDSSQKVQIQKNAGTYLEYYPSVWYNEFQGGHVWVTTLGHSIESYQDPVYINHLTEGIRYIASTFKGLDYSKAYANHRDDNILR